MAPVILQVHDLQTQFKTYDGWVHAVNGVSFDLSEGETLGVVGESGCGKSVTMLSLMGLIPQPPGKIVSGKALFMSDDLFKKPEEDMRRIRGHQIAMIFQDPMTSLNPVLTIGRQLTEAMVLHLGMTPEQARQRAVEMLNMVGIPQANERLSDYPHQFSGGQRQRVMIAMALSCSPQILIADEPTTALDVTIQAQIVDLVVRLRDTLGMAIIWITHDLGVVARLAQRVIVMYAGFIVEHAAVDDLYEDPRHPYTIALLGALPRVDCTRAERLTALTGLPPNLLSMPSGCPFAPRCKFAIERCTRENPALAPVGLHHDAACWVDTRTGASR